MPLDNTNYREWAVEEIDANRTDMPSHIKAIRSSDLSAAALMQAERFFQREKDTQSVQIEVPVSQGLIRLAQKFRNSADFEEKVITPVDVMEWIKETPESLSGFLTKRFQRWAQSFEGGNETSEHFAEWERMLTNMPQSAGRVWPKAFMGWESWHFVTTRTKENLHFHTHPAFKTFLPPNDYEMNYPGFFLNLTQASVGTVFKDDAKKTLWVSKPWSYNLFSTEGHKNLTECMHSVPDKRLSGEEQKRFTDIIGVYPHDENDMPSPY